MKKRGFSLVELLAVMIILGVIISLAIPKIGNIKDSFKEKTFTTNTYSLVKMAEKIYQESHLGSLKEESELYRIQDGKIFNNGTELALIDGKIEGNGFIQLTSDGLSKIAIENDEFCAVKEFTQAEVIVNKRVEGTPCGKVFIPFSYDLNGGDTTQEFEDSYLETTEIVLQNPTKEDTIFDKWVVVKGNSTIKDNVLTIGNRGTKIYALWIKGIMLTVNLNEGSSSQSINGEHKAGTNIVLTTPTREGYTFIGWEVVSGDSIVSGNTITIGSTDTTIKAKWQIDKVNINYNLNGGTSGSSAPTEGNYGTIVTVSKPSKIGYTFTNWTVSGTGASINDTSLTIGTSDVTLTANWTINTYTITYNLDGGTFQNDMPTQAEYGSTIVLENPTREGYVFAGWTVSGNNTILSGDNLTIGDGNITLTSEWAINAEFAYTGAEQTYTAATDGYYKLEVWGAQGGSYNETYRGGYGGYSTGTIYLKKEDIIYTNVGGSGSYVGANVTGIGGYNGGGGVDYTWSDGNEKRATGGGATHIAFSSGLLSKFKNNINDVLIVAGGGGAAQVNSAIIDVAWGIGGSGGGYIGGKGTGKNYETTCDSYGATQLTGGTADCNGNVGLFGKADISNGGNSSGGGGGWYGGSCSLRGASGGSSYIGNSLLTNKYMYCYNCQPSDVESTKTYTTTCTNETPTENCAKKGNGYAKITFVGKTIE